MEDRPTAEISAAPQHPYTRALLSAVAGLSPDQRRLDRRIRLGEERAAAPGGCPFAGRCPDVHDACSTRPPLQDVGHGRRVACHLVTPGQDVPQLAASQEDLPP
jgi:oligopeptide/dipeptide ABC transporter ATP-binding protein